MSASAQAALKRLPLKVIDSHCNVPSVLAKFPALRAEVLGSSEVSSHSRWSTFDFMKHISGFRPPVRGRGKRGAEQPAPPADVAVSAVISVSSDLATRTETEELARHHPLIFSAFGLHPLYCNTLPNGLDHELAEIERLAQHPSCVAVGEMGFDFHDFGPEAGYACTVEVQEPVFRAQIEIAKRLKKPIVLHTREANEDTLRVMKELLPRDYFIHAHCFTESPDFMKQLLDNFDNLYVGFSGLVTFSKSAEDARRACRECPIDRLMLETDAPFLAPEPFRGSACAPSMVSEVAKAVAELKQIPLDQLVESVNANTRRMFNLDMIDEA